MPEIDTTNGPKKGVGAGFYGPITPPAEKTTEEKPAEKTPDPKPVEEKKEN